MEFLSWTIRLCVAVAFLVLELSSSLNAATPSFWERDQLSGDWSGKRDAWAQQGYEFSFEYHTELFGNISGGKRRGVAFEGLGHAMMDVDLERAFGWSSTVFRISSLWLHGTSPSSRFVGDDLAVSYIDGFDSLRLYETWIEKTFWENRLSVRAGNLLADEEFCAAGYGYIFLNAAFGWPTFISGNTLNSGPAFFVPGLGGRLRYELNESWYLQAGIYDGDTFDDANGDPNVNPHGFHFRLGKDQGYLSMYEMGFRSNQDKGAAGLPGHYRVGGWHHTGNFSDHDGLTTHGDNWGLYFAGDQMLWREEGEQGLGLFYRVGGSPRDRNKFEWAMDGGLSYQGLIPGRDRDIAGIGVAFAQHSADLTTDHEMAIEATYSIRLTPAIYLQPDVQWIHHPGGGGISDAWVVGLRIGFEF